MNTGCKQGILGVINDATESFVTNLGTNESVDEENESSNHDESDLNHPLE
jgi:hypothetical protein